MGFTGVPLFIGGDKAQHSAKASRLLSYAPFNGGEGVVRPSHCRIVEGATPGAFVDMRIGAVVIEGRGPQQFCQSYADLADTEGSVNITPTDSSGTRYDLIIARVEDPHDGSGLWPVPSDPANGPYLHLRVIENVPSDTTTLTELFPQIGVMSGIPLARLRIPASTATITQGMITDLRFLANPRKDYWQDTNRHSGATLYTNFQTGTRLEFPRENGKFTVPVPHFATKMNVRLEVSTATAESSASPANMWGNNEVFINGANVAGFSEWNEDWNGGQSRFSMTALGDVDVTAYQGQSVTVESTINFQGGGDNLHEDNGTNVHVQAYFSEETL